MLSPSELPATVDLAAFRVLLPAKIYDSGNGE